jgi:hypothetical protein
LKNPLMPTNPGDNQAAITAPDPRDAEAGRERWDFGPQSDIYLVTIPMRLCSFAVRIDIDLSVTTPYQLITRIIHIVLPLERNSNDL